MKILENPQERPKKQAVFSNDTHRRILVSVHISDLQQDCRIKLCLTKKRYTHTDK